MILPRFRHLAAALLLVATAGASLPAAAGTAVVGFAGRFNVPVVSLAERPFQTVVRQRLDYSCGSAALATLLRHHYGGAVGEAEIFQAMYAAGDKARIQEVGFSLLDMKRYLAGHGYRADGFRIALDDLAKVGVPAIALVEIDGYRHFVVIKGIESGEILVGDPATGLETYSQAAFEAIRVDDIVFVIRDQAKRARSSFNREAEWANLPPAAPLGQRVGARVLADHGTLARIPAQFRFPLRENVR